MSILNSRRVLTVGFGRWGALFPERRTCYAGYIDVFGIIIYLYFKDNRKHNTPHVHAEYGEFEGIFDITTAEMIKGDLPKPKISLVEAWIQIHKDELLADWRLALKGETPFKIDPLR